MMVEATVASRERRAGVRPSRTRRVVCATCGRAFLARRSDCTYCAPVCRQRSYRRRRMAVAGLDEAALPTGSAAHFRRAVEHLSVPGLTDGEQRRILCAIAAALDDGDWHWVGRLITATPLCEHPRAAARAAEHAAPAVRSADAKIHTGLRVLAEAAAAALGCEHRGRGLTSEYRLPQPAR